MRGCQPSFNPQNRGPSIVGCSLILIQYIRNCSSYLEVVSCVNKPRTRHTVLPIRWQRQEKWWSGAWSKEQVGNFSIIVLFICNTILRIWSKKATSLHNFILVRSQLLNTLPCFYCSIQIGVGPADAGTSLTSRSHRLALCESLRCFLKSYKTFTSRLNTQNGFLCCRTFHHSKQNTSERRAEMLMSTSRFTTRFNPLMHNGCCMYCQL